MSVGSLSAVESAADAGGESVGVVVGVADGVSVVGEGESVAVPVSVLDEASVLPAGEPIVVAGESAGVPDVPVRVVVDVSAVFVEEAAETSVSVVA